MLAKNTFKLSNSTLCLFALGICALSSIGCSTMFQNVSTANTPVDPAVQSAGSFFVEMRPAFGKPVVYEGQLDGPLTVQNALDRSGAIKKFRGMNIGLYRVVKENGRNLKLPVVYNFRSKSVAPEQDYALHPGDRILIDPKSNSPLDQVMDSLNRD